MSAKFQLRGKGKLIPLLIGGAILLQIPDGTAWAAASVPPAPSLIRVDNRVTGTSDSVTVNGLSPGDMVKVYRDAGAASPLGSATVGSGSTSAVVTIGQLGVESGHVYVTVTQPSYSESKRIVKSYAEEPLSASPAATSIRVTNRSGTSSDKVTVRGLAVGDVVRIYADSSKTKLLGSNTVAASTTDGTVVSVGSLGAEAGVLYVAVTEPGRRESRATEKAYEAEPVTEKLRLEQIRIVNELGGANDRVTVSGIKPGDTVKLYASDKAAAPFAQATAASGQSEVTISASLPSSGGDDSIYVSVTTPPLRESVRVSKRYREEPKTPPINPGMITVTNEQEGTQDHIELIGLSAGDVVKVYSSETATTTIATATVGADSSRAVIKIAQLGKGAGYVYITLTSPSKGESSRTVKAYAAEQSSVPADRADIQIRNIAGPDDTVTVTGLKPGDMVKVYAEEAAAEPIGKASVGSGAVTAEVKTTLPGTGYGIVYVTVTRADGEESPRTPKIYPAEPLTLPIAASYIQVDNNTEAGGRDEVTVTGLKAGDRVRLYDDALSSTPMQTALGQQADAVVAEGSTVVTLDRLELKPDGGKLYVTVTSKDRRESSRTMKAYEAE
ncbi:hypothetical protein N0M98_15025 [Paenibacillus doosanensis]|uniref:hypothetical protein n=1 Tax=Paenibacillus doosanensis TaxID=1229154 RepID=UPI00217F4A87|nr:hypothetical protein [Paenibacillus doosanensis]MCS7461463.1 hypothetical protein [Paenibacillus doosanensis]